MQKCLRLFFLLLIFSLPAFAKSESVVLLTIDSAIGPATQDYVHRGLQYANDHRAELMIIRMDTPGGLDKSMREIIKEIISSNIPVVTYVAPAGARAASAGTYILYASHIAAMAPGTNLGAATPVTFSGFGAEPGSTGKSKMPSEENTMKQKMMNDAVAYIRSLAELRGRNADWAQKAVIESASLSAQNAHRMKVIDIVADDVPDLLSQLNGRKISLPGHTQELQTKNISVMYFQPDWRIRLLATITDPNVAYILLLIGIYGLFFEFVNPGFVVPGVAGAIALLLALYAFQLLPINYAGLALILTGIVFLIGEAYMPTFGALGIGGIIAFVIGSLLLLNTDIPGFSLAWSLVIIMAAVNAIFFLAVISIALRALKRQVVSGREALIYSVGTVIDDFEKQGWIRIEGETWQARSETPLHKGQPVRVLSMDGLVLTVAPLTTGEKK